jgi:hypothetical protein
MIRIIDPSPLPIPDWQSKILPRVGLGIFKRLLKTPIARGCKASGNAIVSAFLLHVGGGSTLV